MLIIVGTVPIKGMPLTQGYCAFEEGKLVLEGQALPLINGTSVVLAAASTVCNALKIEPPYAIVAGDVGTGDGSNLIYRFLRDGKLKVSERSSRTVVGMSYIKPNILYAKEAIKALKRGLNATLIADAGSMYVAKAAGLAKEFDLFTPDLGEMAFLADSEAMHPAFTRNYLFDSTNNVPKLVKQAYENFNASSYLLIKGVIDYIINNGKIVAEVGAPCVSALEPIGGTGDSLTGIVSALVASGIEIEDAAILAAKVNRVMGAIFKPNPSTKVWEIIPKISEALQLIEKTPR